VVSAGPEPAGAPKLLLDEEATLLEELLALEEELVATLEDEEELEAATLLEEEAALEEELATTLELELLAEPPVQASVALSIVTDAPDSVRNIRNEVLVPTLFQLQVLAPMFSRLASAFTTRDALPSGELPELVVLLLIDTWNILPAPLAAVIFTVSVQARPARSNIPAGALVVVLAEVAVAPTVKRLPFRVSVLPFSVMLDVPFTV
jgi:hypothetical protein